MNSFLSNTRLSPAVTSAHTRVGMGARAHGFAVPTRMTADSSALAWRAAP